MNAANNRSPNGDRRAEVERLAAQWAQLLTDAGPVERPVLEALFAKALREGLARLNGGADAHILALKAPPLTPELREWLDQQHTDEEIIAWIQELREMGGLEFSEFFPELERMVSQP